MNKREFITLLGGAAAWPLAARAQQGERVRRVGILVVQAERDAQVQSNVAMFQRRLAELGWVEDRNTRFDTATLMAIPSACAPTPPRSSGSSPT